MSTPIDHQVALANEITTILREEIGYHEQFALPIAQAVVNGLIKRRAGDLLYIPTVRACSRRAIAERNAAIRREFNGRNCKELCAKYKVSRPWLYRIVKIV